MDLFNQDTEQNILPIDGEAIYYGPILNSHQNSKFYDELINNIAWRNDEANIFGKLIITKRKVAWYADHPFEYTYSNRTKVALPWTDVLLELKQIVEKSSGETYNSCLLNLYHSGDEGMAWHSDGETDLKRNGAIGSLSFGAERKFAFKHKESKQTVSIILEKGTLLVMKGETQTHWLHRLPPSTKVKSPRINLTFRTILK